MAVGANGLNGDMGAERTLFDDLTVLAQSGPVGSASAGASQAPNDGASHNDDSLANSLASLSTVHAGSPPPTQVGTPQTVIETVEVASIDPASRSSGQQAQGRDRNGEGQVLSTAEDRTSRAETSATTTLTVDKPRAPTEAPAAELSRSSISDDGSVPQARSDGAPITLVGQDNAAVSPPATASEPSTADKPLAAETKAEPEPEPDVQIIPEALPAVGDGVVLTVSPAQGDEDHAIALSISAALIDSADTMGSVTIRGVPDGATLSAGVVQADGSWVLSASDLGGLSLRPAADAHGSFDLTIESYSTEGGVQSGIASATLHVTVDAANDAPALSGTASLPGGTEDTSYVIRAADLLSKASDVDGDTMSVANLAASSGTLVNNGDGTWSLTPAANANGAVTLSYDVVDGNGGSVATSTSVTFAAVNDAPALSGTASLPGGTEDTSYVIRAADLLSKASDVDGDTMSVANLAVSSGTLVNNGDGTWSLTPAANANGAVTLSYDVVDGNGGSVATSTSVTFAAVNDAPAQSGTASLPGGTEDTSYVIRAADLLSKASDVDGDTMSVANLAASSGTLVNNGDGTWSLTPAANANGAVTLSYDVVDGNGGSVATSTAVTFAAVNDAPTNAALNLGTKQGDQTLILTKAQLLANAGDVDGDTLSVTGLSASAGTLTANADGTWSLTTVANQPADITLSYTVDDGHGGTAAGSASITVIPVSVQITGGAGNDTLTGTAGNDLIDGGAGNDILNGVGGADTVLGGVGNDTIDAGAGDDLLSGGAGGDKLNGNTGTDTATYADSAAGVTVNLSLATAQTSTGDASGDILSGIENVTGSALNDTLTGNASANVIDGLAGNDVLAGLAGADTLIGGAGADTASYAASSGAVTVNLATGTGSGGDAEGDVLSGIENVTGGAGNDVLTGDAGANRLDGGSGDDLLVGGGGADSLVGGAGTDTASYASSSAGVTVNLALATAQVSGGDASGDVLNTIENVVGSAFDDTLTGNTGNNVLTGGAGADTLAGGTGSDTVDYSASGAGVTVNLALATAQVSGGDAGGDMLSGIENLTGSAQADVLTGDANANLLQGGAGADTLDGAAGNDVLRGGAGADTLIGGAGTDSVTYSDSSAGVAVSLSLSTAQSGGDAEGDVLSGIEYLTGSALADTLTGDANANLLDGGAGNDVIDGGAGNDQLVGGAGADTLMGGVGIDLANYSSATIAVTVDLSTGAGTGGDAQGDVLSGIENLTGGTGGDVLTGDGAANVLDGGTGNDTLSGGAGADTLVGGAGNDVLDGGADNDTLTGGAGADTLTGGTGNDTASYAGATAALSVDLETGTGSGGDAAGDVLSGIENIIGGNLADVLTGDGAANVLDGGAGNDTLTGGAGDDLLRGGAGADVLAGGDGNDTASWSSSTAAVSANLSAGTGTLGDALGDVLSGIENLTGGSGADILTGDGGANILTGGTGNDTLDGGNGNDLLAGGAGADKLTGGTGTDTADYSASTAAVTVNLTTGTGTVGDASGDVLSGIENLTGGAGADILSGDAGVNVIDGGAGNDTLSGGAGGDTLIGGAGTDTASYAGSGAALSADLAAGTLSGGDADGDVLSGIESITGTNFNDLLAGDGNANRLDGGAGDDSLRGSAGADSLIGGTGTDTVGYETSAAGVTVNLSLTTAQVSGGDASGDVLATIENAVGSAFGDTLTGTTGVNILTGGDGDDVLIGLAGADTLVGGAGIDTASYAPSTAAVTVNLTTGTGTVGDASGDVLSGIENLTGGAGADILSGDAGVNVIDGGAGNDTLSGGAGGDTLIGGAGTDTASYAASGAALSVDLAAGTVSGGDADGDVLSGIESITGTNFNDLLAGDGNANRLDGGAGDDSLRGGAGADSLIGGTGTDTVGYETSAAGVTVIDGGAGNDTLSGGAGGDTLIGGAGTDTASYAGSGAALSADLAAGTLSGGDADGDVLSGIESITGTNFNDLLAGDGNANRLDGGAGDDSLRGGAGADSLIGGTGTDTVGYETSAAGVTVNLSLTTAQVSGGDASGDVLATIENAVGSAFGDTLTGTTGVNVLTGGDGDDVLRGLAGADTLVGGDGIDTASYAAATVAVNVNLATGTGSGGDAAGDVLSGIENLLGGNAADILTGDGGANVLNGAAGNDTLSGGAGADTLIGGAGADSLIGGTGSDTADYSASTLAVNVDLTRATAQSGGDAAGDILAGIENLTGGGGNDVLTGDSGANILIGGGGSDTLTGAAGDDLLVFRASDFPAGSGGTLADFVYGGGGVDTVDISAVGQSFQLLINGVEQPLPAGSHEYVDTQGIQGDIRFGDNSVIHLDGIEKIIY
ncbi:protein of unknown function (RTX toxins and related Ca2+-binding proteins 343-2320) [Magnetospirillum sp. XM-1]|uniref:cadherin-like domain-containing protein n=1 Tax=Magnetospirillum sp. XM-1 TaxID=1663591 RepID=UPI00073E0281|nr:cadherin-like domain-containing protein [Magnetospirillum sp. XM-1]CUW39588.1 protein of unknown function (RTX toxins and related Ca2+-binding proteins 343-2320) [Magnetospirillum sp. XM-1]